MVPTDNAGAGVLGKFGGREDVLPDPFPAGIRIFAFQGVGEGALP
jgi:hypothetical protein